MATPLSIAEDVLRRAEWTTRADWALAALPRLWGCVIGFGCLYGAAMGAYRGVNGQPEWLLQMAYSAIKAPLLLSGSFVLTLPAFFVFSSLFGLREDFGRAARALVAAQAGLAIALASLAPLTLLIYASTPSYDLARLSSGLMFLIASLAGQSLLRSHARPLIARNPRHRWLLVAWGVTYAFVAIQLAWLLRPFFGAAGMRVTFLRQEAWDNAYVELLRILWRALGG